jgi:hypothetical protein
VCVARIEEVCKAFTIFDGKLVVRGRMEDRSVDESVILKWIYK